MKAKGESLPTKILTLEQAAGRFLRQKKAEHSDESLMIKQHACGVAYLKLFWRPDTQLTQIDAQEVQWFIRKAIDSGPPGDGARKRHVNTVVEKDLPLLSALFKTAGLPSPVEQIRKSRKLPKKVSPQMRFLGIEEIVTVIRRIRNETFFDSRGRPQRLTARETHADLLEFIACTGIRSGELSRLTVDHVDLKRKVILVAEPKDRSNPRRLETTPNLVKAIERLCQAASTHPQKLLVPGGMSYVYTIARRWGKRLGIDHLNGRTLRHSFATGLATEGVPSVTIRDLMGHRSLRTTDRYVHAVSGLRREAVSRLARHFQADESTDG